MRKKLIAALAAAMILAGCAARSSAAEPSGDTAAIIADLVSNEQWQEAGGQRIFHFGADGTGTLDVAGAGTGITYSAEGTTVVIKYEGKEHGWVISEHSRARITGSYDSGTLTLVPYQKTEPTAQKSLADVLVGGSPWTDQDVIYVFNADGSGTYEADSYGQPMIYSISGSEVTIRTGEATITWTVTKYDSSQVTGATDEGQQLTLVPDDEGTAAQPAKLEGTWVGTDSRSAKVGIRLSIAGPSGILTYDKEAGSWKLTSELTGSWSVADGILTINAASGKQSFSYALGSTRLDLISQSNDISWNLAKQSVKVTDSSGKALE